MLKLGSYLKKIPLTLSQRDKSHENKETIAWRQIQI